MRIAIGSGKCSDLSRSRNPKLRELCSRILSRVERLGALPLSALMSLPESSSELERINSQVVSFTTYREVTESGDCLLVVQGFLPSWQFPRYFGPAGIGFMVAEGLVLNQVGTLTLAPDDLLWEFR
ncbi:hypothetical protein [Cognatiluteimonas weifangensis]|nr:hypothetical protein [Luteimonas weifangensis]